MSGRTSPAAVGHHRTRASRIADHDRPAVRVSHQGGLARTDHKSVPATFVARPQDAYTVHLLGLPNHPGETRRDGQGTHMVLLPGIEAPEVVPGFAEHHEDGTCPQEYPHARAANRVRSSWRAFPGANRSSPSRAAPSMSPGEADLASRRAAQSRSSSNNSPSGPSASVMPSV